MTNSKPMDFPVIVITGTPGTGKSSLCRRVEKLLNAKHLDISAIAKENGYVDSYDEKLETHVLDEGKLLDHLERELATSSEVVLLDYHSCGLFPERWVMGHPQSVVVVLKCSTESLFDRLSDRGYSVKKRQENMEAEIFRICEDEARMSYPEGKVFSFENNTNEDAERITLFLQDRLKQQPAAGKRRKGI